MNIDVKGKGIDMGDALRTFITDTLTDHIIRYFDRSLDAHVTVSKQAGVFHMDLALHVPGEILTAQGEADDAHAAYHIAADKLFTQVKKYKSRVRDHHKGEHGGASNDVADKAVSA